MSTETESGTSEVQTDDDIDDAFTFIRINKRA